MTVASMTGFARASGVSPPYRWAWEVKTVNAKGLDLRLRLPPGFDSIELGARALLGQALSRGACVAALTATRDNVPPVIRVNHTALAALIAAVQSIPLDANLRPASLDGLLGLRGIVDVLDATDDPAAHAVAETGALATLAEAIEALVAMRREEGQQRPQRTQ